MDAISDVSRGSDIISSAPIFPPHPKPLNLDDLFGFNELARKRLSEEIVEEKYFIANKIFINHVDSFTGKHIMLLLSENKLPKCETYFEDDHKNQIEVAIVHKAFDGLKQNHINSKDKSYSQVKDKIPAPNLPIIDNDNGTNLLEGKKGNCFRGTNKMTIAEYYDMMELESLECKNNFIKEKIGKNYDQSLEVNDFKSGINSTQHNVHDIYTSANTVDSKYEIVATVRNKSTEEIEGITVIKEASIDNPAFLKQILKCGIIIYCVNESVEQAIEATVVLNTILSFINETKPKPSSPKFVLVSTFMTWALTKPLTLREELPFVEKDYKKRIPHPNYHLVYELEEQLLKAKLEGKIKSTIIVSGLPYGHEENELRHIFLKAYFYTNVPIYSQANNLIPTIHVENLAQVVKITLEQLEYSSTPFVFAKDPVQQPISDICQAISMSLGTGICDLRSKEFAFIDEMVSQGSYDKITSNIFLESCYPLFREEDILWKYKSGIVKNINHIVNEFVEAEQNKPLRLIFYNVKINDQLKNVAEKVSKYCNIPFINPQQVICKHFESVFKNQAMVEGKLSITSEIKNVPSLKIAKLSQDLILCESEKYFEYEKEMIKKLKISTDSSVEKHFLHTPVKENILKRILKMKPYIYHGFILEEYPNFLEEANILFSQDIDGPLNDESLVNIQIIPDMVLFYNKKELSKTTIFEREPNQSDDGIILTDSEDQDSQPQDSSHHLQKIPGISSADINLNNKTQDKNCLPDNNSTSYIVNNNAKGDYMPLFFSKFGDKCTVATLDFSDQDSEDSILFKTLDLIQNHNFSGGKNIVLPLSIIDHFQSMQTISKKESQSNKYLTDTKLQIVENLKRNEPKKAVELILAIRSYPLLCYLINFIFPTLTNGIFKVAAQTPKDPIDALVEYIFKNNPLGHMIPRKEFSLDKRSMWNKKKNFPKIDSKACLA